jgi:predicted phage tail protein
VAATHVTAAAETSAMAAAKTCVAAEASAMSAAGVTSAMLRPQGHGQEKRERRNGHQAAHS